MKERLSLSNPLTLRQPRVSCNDFVDDVALINSETGDSTTVGSWLDDTVPPLYHPDVLPNRQETFGVRIDGEGVMTMIDFASGQESQVARNVNAGHLDVFWNQEGTRVVFSAEKELYWVGVEGESQRLGRGAGSNPLLCYHSGADVALTLTSYADQDNLAVHDLEGGDTHILTIPVGGLAIRCGFSEGGRFVTLIEDLVGATLIDLATGEVSPRE